MISMDFRDAIVLAGPKLKQGIPSMRTHVRTASFVRGWDVGPLESCAAPEYQQNGRNILAHPGGYLVQVVIISSVVVSPSAT